MKDYHNGYLSSKCLYHFFFFFFFFFDSLKLIFHQATFSNYSQMNREAGSYFTLCKSTTNFYILTPPFFLFLTLTLTYHYLSMMPIVNLLCPKNRGSYVHSFIYCTHTLILQCTIHIDYHHQMFCVNLKVHGPIFSKSSFLFHLKNHHSKDVNVKFH